MRAVLAEDHSLDLRHQVEPLHLHLVWEAEVLPVPLQEADEQELLVDCPLDLVGEDLH